MKLRFEVDQAECLRRGVDLKSLVVTITVDPAKLRQNARNLIAVRLLGFDVHWIETVNAHGSHFSGLIVANEPTLSSLLEAIHANEEHLRPQRESLRKFQALMQEAGDLEERARAKIRQRGGRS